MDRDQLKSYLPHREPMLLVDEATGDETGGRGSYTVKGDEYFLNGHFPGNPVVPGVILCEIAAQICSVSLKERLRGSTPYFSGLDRVKFRRPVVPGDRFEVTFTVTAVKEPFYFYSVKGEVGGMRVMSGDLSFAVK